MLLLAAKTLPLTIMFPPPACPMSPKKTEPSATSNFPLGFCVPTPTLPAKKPVVFVIENCCVHAGEAPAGDVHTSNVLGLIPAIAPPAPVFLNCQLPAPSR